MAPLNKGENTSYDGSISLAPSMVENTLSRATYHEFSVHWHNPGNDTRGQFSQAPSAGMIGSLGHAPQQMCRRIRPKKVYEHGQAVPA